MNDCLPEGTSPKPIGKEDEVTKGETILHNAKQECILNKKEKHLLLPFILTTF